MADKVGLFTGSFDPITKGHLEIIERASFVFTKLYVGIFCNHEKENHFPLSLRQSMVEKALQHLDNVEVVVAKGLAVDVAQQLGVTAFVRGLRTNQDLSYEAGLQFFNHDLAPEIETVFFLSHPMYQAISSSRIRELLALGKSIAAYVPESVVQELRDHDVRK